MHYLFGIDGGGTGCRAILANKDGTILGNGLSGPANIGADTPNAIRHIREAAEQARLEAGLHSSIYETSSAVLGLAGANSLADPDSVYEALPFAESRIVSDTITALQGAVGNGDGAIAILGTGSAFAKRTGNIVKIVGGHGFMLSDHAGGARLGRDLLEQSLLAHDGIVNETVLTTTIMSRFGNDAHKITQFSRTATAADYAIFAPMVFEFFKKDDPLALKLLSDACVMIERQLDKLNIKAGKRFSIIGGLASSYASLDLLPYKEYYIPAQGDSLQGALALALQKNADHATATRR
ncbi:BadF/BadG/BcrA/BcrD ATPase family protein [Brucella gallinifaecis]|uniref:ATPase n=1 Tax=Brucella gallinifaecis TaxID=215590 RepID=A0A502BK87_9HYPH|nr:BadF/BadG/BcrA/BcrD ATPase family protein [Brucella gallinifaecis]TPF74410.1 ATPase [Brucella gallinifaecis]